MIWPDMAKVPNPCGSFASSCSLSLWKVPSVLGRSDLRVEVPSSALVVEGGIAAVQHSWEFWT